jgi:hypothetical protein
MDGACAPRPALGPIDADGFPTLWHFDSLRTKQISEALVVAELGRRGIIATVFVNTLPDVAIPILAHKDGASLALQVDSVGNGAAHLDADPVADSDAAPEPHGDRMTPGPAEDLVHVFVLIGERGMGDRFFILTPDELQSRIAACAQAGQVSTRPAQVPGPLPRIPLAQLQSYEDRWETIAGRLAARAASLHR